MICNNCKRAADTEDITNEQREEMHKLCASCDCHHHIPTEKDPYVDWNAVRQARTEER